MKTETTKVTYTYHTHNGAFHYIWATNPRSGKPLIKLAWIIHYFLYVINNELAPLVVGVKVNIPYYVRPLLSLCYQLCTSTSSGGSKS